MTDSRLLPNLAGATVVFDLDGALVDTAPDLIGVLNVMLAEAGHPPVALSSARRLVGRGARAMLEHGFAEAGAPLEPARTPALVERFVQLYLPRIARESRPFPGCEVALDVLADAGATLCVCTNKLTALSRALIEALGMSHRFAAVVGPDAAPARKPDAAHVFAAIEAAAGDPARAVFVGDSVIDLRAARAAQLPIVGVGFGYCEVEPAEAGFDVVIDHYAELAAACDRLLAAD